MTRATASLWETRSAADASTTEMAELRASDGSVVFLPLAGNRIAATPLIRYSCAQSPWERAVRRAGWLGLRTGTARPLLRHRVHVVTSGDAEPTLHEYLAAGLGVERVELAVALGPPRVNRKPVVRVMTDGGETLAFAKVGWNAVTSSLVSHEAAFLRSAAARRLRLVAIPDVVSTGMWRGHAVSILAPIPTRPGRCRPSPEVFVDVAEADGLTRSSILPSDHWSSLARDMSGLDPDLRRPAQAVASALLSRWGDVPLTYGRWHGDWSRWNTGRVGDGRIALWDWERTGTGFPLGFDVLHHHLAAGTSRATPERVLSRLRRDSSGLLDRLGVGSEARAPLLSLYLLQVYLRHAAPPLAYRNTVLISALTGLMLSSIGLESADSAPTS